MSDEITLAGESKNLPCWQPGEDQNLIKEMRECLQAGLEVLGFDTDAGNALDHDEFNRLLDAWCKQAERLIAQTAQ